MKYLCNYRINSNFASQYKKRTAYQIMICGQRYLKSIG